MSADARTLSHELRTPLLAIQGWAHIFQRKLPQNDVDLQKGIEVIERSTRAQAQLIDDLLDMGSAALEGIKVLLVDDEPDARDVLRRLLATYGAEVFTANGAAAALAVVREVRPDVPLSDIGLPQIDGYELLRQVRALGQAAGGNLPAIAITAFARAEDRVRALRAGYLAHLAKPVEPSEVIAVVARVAGNEGSGPL
jgi:CheY-like chemotaxis protein